MYYLFTYLVNYLLTYLHIYLRPTYLPIFLLTYLLTYNSRSAHSHFAVRSTRGHFAVRSRSAHGKGIYPLPVFKLMFSYQRSRKRHGTLKWAQASSERGYAQISIAAKSRLVKFRKKMEAKLTGLKSCTYVMVAVSVP